MSSTLARVALITAAGSGMGAASARELAAQGWQVAVMSASGSWAAGITGSVLEQRSGPRGGPRCCRRPKGVGIADDRQRAPEARLVVPICSIINIARRAGHAACGARDDRA
jgi:NAD(P)-dependent dehydrogenase (short-subunit alcohol dehydrogenase family)